MVDALLIAMDERPQPPRPFRTAGRPICRKIPEIRLVAGEGLEPPTSGL